MIVRGEAGSVEICRGKAGRGEIGRGILSTKQHTNDPFYVLLFFMGSLLFCSFFGSRTFPGSMCGHLPVVDLKFVSP